MSVVTPLKLYNTLSREREVFAPLDPDNVRLYVCGPTVYDLAHIGNARPLIVFDALYRLLREKYGPDHVTYVRNITDVDDKINARAAERGITIRELTEETNRVFQEDVAALNCLEPNVQPRATEHIAEMIAIIEQLIAKGHAYAADGHVLFDVPSMPDYGALSRRPLEDMVAGARVEVAPYKKGEMDFVLWKPSKEGEPGWDSPWGRGRPGWHIECSAMSHKHLGEVFDIHGGGIDLVFPHHENEIAQTRCAFGHDVMAKVWMHNGFLQVEGEKMSKSLGNFITIHELLHTDKFGGKAWKGEVLRLAMMRSHYRQPIDWTVKALEEAEKTLSRWYGVLRAHGLKAADTAQAPLRAAFVEALCDDLNIPRAMAELHALASKAEPRDSDSQTTKAEAEKLARAASLLGLLQDDPTTWAQRAPEVDVDVTEVKKLVAERLAARKARNFSESDRLRDVLAEMGVKLKDGKDKATGEPTTEWEVA